MSQWRRYQEEAAQFFRDLGLEAETDVTLTGPRTTHDVDVAVRSKNFGFDLLWIVECKHWNSRVGKLHVLGLRQIVIEVGADRGILLSESGFQKGAKDAANLTNVHTTSIADLRDSAKLELTRARLPNLSERHEECAARYWRYGKYDRIEYGLRPDLMELGWSGAAELSKVRSVLAAAYSGKVPAFHQDMRFPRELAGMNIPDLVVWVECKLKEIESRLDAAEEAMS